MDTRRYMPSIARSYKPEESSDTLTQHAHVTMLVAMPSMERSLGRPSREVVIGTTLLPYREPESDDEDEEELSRIILNSTEPCCRPTETER